MDPVSNSAWKVEEGAVEVEKTEFLITVLFNWVPNLLRRNCQRQC